MYVGYPTARTFEVRNFGTDPLVVMNIEPGSPVLGVSPVSFVVAPGEARPVEVVFAAEAAGGPGHAAHDRESDRAERAISRAAGGRRRRTTRRLWRSIRRYSTKRSLAGQTIVRDLRITNPGGADLIVTLGFDTGVDPAVTGDPQPPWLTNGGFESGDFAGWTPSTTGDTSGGWWVTRCGREVTLPTDPFEGSLDAWNTFNGVAGSEYTDGPGHRGARIRVRGTDVSRSHSVQRLRHLRLAPSRVRGPQSRTSRASH